MISNRAERVENGRVPIMTRISVIIPVWNAEATIGATLKSLQSQTFQDWDCICVDDGCTDGTREILHGYLNRFHVEGHEMRILSQNHLGVAVARNRGMEAADGQYVFFLDSADVLPPEALMKLNDLAEKSDADIVWGRCLTVRNEEIEKYAVVHSVVERDRTWMGDEWLAQLDAYFDNSDIHDEDSGFTSVPAYTCNKLLRRSCVGDMRFEDCLRRGEDSVFFVQIFSRVRKAAATDACTYLIRKREDSLSRQASADFFNEYAMAACRLAEVSAARSLMLYNYAHRDKFWWFYIKMIRESLLTGRMALEPSLRNAFRTGCRAMYDSWKHYLPLFGKVKLLAGSWGWLLLLRWYYGFRLGGGVTNAG